ncbi:AAA family ATPase [Rhodococcus fascians]|uniref:AAA family ATPase n=1 Tax=Rhodococcoides fascians TaxID=1828 RepID=UPI0024B77F5A|nr:AAA family ATPase [Rhodococcus fascians]MDJ0004836.1 AAA family ATPase [Rhodococcus fascians]
MSESVWHDGLTLRRWRLRNFKSVQHADVELAPLTVIVGANSAGKSTLLQSIRVAAQAATSNSEFLPLNGEQIRVGTFDETRFSGAREADNPIVLGGQFHFGSESYSTVAPGYGSGHFPRRRFRRQREHGQDTFIDWDLTLMGAPKQQSASTNIVGIEVSAFVTSELHSSLHAERSATPTSSYFGHEYQYEGTVTEAAGEPIELTDLNLRGGFPIRYMYTEPLADILFWAWYEGRQAAMRANLPRDASARTRERWLNEDAKKTSDESGPMPGTAEVVDAITADLRSILDDLQDVLQTPNAQRMLYIRVRELADAREWRLDSDWPRTQLAEIYQQVTERLGLGDRRGPKLASLPDLLDSTVSESRDFLANRVQHLGPLRMDPQVVYRSSPTANPGFIGAKGEYTASVLETGGDQRIQNPPVLPDGKRSSQTLLKAVNSWAAHLGIGDGFSTEDSGRLGLQLSVRPSDVNLDLDLTSVGTGVSQILPVLVMCLQAPPGSLLLIEQPELHLNPAVQQRLADFLLAVASSGRQLIVETHSDYLITRLRRRTAEDQTDLNQERITIIFAERHDGATTYKGVRPASDGSMADWPSGFFDESAQDSQALMEALIERAEK